jgi:hypothetical protein
MTRLKCAVSVLVMARHQVRSPLESSPGTKPLYQLPGFSEARDLSQFGHDRHRRDLGDSSQGLRGLDQRSPLGGRRSRCLQNCVVQPFHAGHQVLDLVDVVGERDLLRGLLDMNLRLDPTWSTAF